MQGRGAGGWLGSEHVPDAIDALPTFSAALADPAAALSGLNLGDLTGVLQGFDPTMLDPTLLTGLTSDFATLPGDLGAIPTDIMSALTSLL